MEHTEQIFALITCPCCHCEDFYEQVQFESMNHQLECKKCKKLIQLKQLKDRFFFKKEDIDYWYDRLDKIKARTSNPDDLLLYKLELYSNIRRGHKCLLSDELFNNKKTDTEVMIDLLNELIRITNEIRDDVQQLNNKL